MTRKLAGNVRVGDVVKKHGEVGEVYRISRNAVPPEGSRKKPLMVHDFYVKGSKVFNRFTFYDKDLVSVVKSREI